jgi:membrane dipeptidase
MQLVFIYLFTKFIFRVPEGLDDVSSYPNLFAELFSVGWSEEDLAKLASLNLIRVFKEVEKVKKQRFS